MELIDRQSKTILLIEGDAHLRVFLHHCLASFGHNQVVDAADCRAARQLAEKQTYSLVIADLRLDADRTGLPFLAEFRKKRMDTPVIVISGDPTADTAVNCLKSGAVDYVTKPFALKRLREAIQKAMNDGERRNVLETAGTAQLQKSLAGYRIMRTLGQGSVGVVYLAEKLVQGNTAQFALKILKDLTFQNSTDRQGVIQRFYREAEIAASIRHPGITSVFEFGVFGQDQIPYLIMEYVDGIALKRIIEEHHPLDYFQKARIIRQVADALSAVHLKGACHRDVKTSNILVRPDMQTKLTDFGIARPFNSEMTVAEDFIGTPAYSAPEAYSSAIKVDHRADIFSLGIVAYELFFQERPFLADTLSLIGHEICTRKPVSPRRRDGSFPRTLQNILGKMLKKHTGERYQSASDLVADLDSFLTGAKLSETVSLWNHLHFADPDWS